MAELNGYLAYQFRELAVRIQSRGEREAPHTVIVSGAAMAPILANVNVVVGLAPLTVLEARPGLRFWRAPLPYAGAQTAAREIEKAASQAADSPSTLKPPATHVVLDQPAFALGNFLWVGSHGGPGVHR